MSPEDQASIPRTRWRLGIGLRYGFLLSTTVLVSVCGTALWAHHRYADALIAQSLDRLRDAARAAAVALEADIAGPGAMAAYVAATPLVANAANPNTSAGLDTRSGSSGEQRHDRLASMFAGILRAAPRLRRVSYVGIDDVGLVSVERPANGADVTRTTVSRGPEETGTSLLATVSGRPAGARPVTELIVRSGRDGGPSDRGPTVRASMAIHGPGGEVTGGVIVDKEIRSTLERVRALAGPARSVYLADARGDLLVQPETEGMRARRLADFLPSVAAALAIREASGIVEDSLPDGTPVTIGYQRIALGEEPGPNATTLLLLARTEESISASLATGRSSLWTLLVALPALVGLGWLASSPLTARLRRMTRAVERFAAGTTELDLPENARDEAGALARALDRMRRQVAERADRLREADTRQRAVIASVSDGLITMDAAGIVETFNPAAEAMFGYTAGEVVGHRVEMLMDDPYRRVHAGYVERYVATEIPRIIGTTRDVEALRKDGTTFPAEISVNATQLAGEQLFTALIRDVTEQRRAETALRNTRERLESIYASANDGIVVIDPVSESIVEANPKCAEVFQYEQSELVGMPVRTIHPHEMPAVRQFASRVMREGTGSTQELSCRTKGGTLMPAWLSASRVEIDGRVLLMVMVRDISDRKRAEEALNALNEELEQRVELRTAELRAAQAELVRRERLAALGQVMATVSHELRNPLGAMRPSLEVVRRHARMPDARVERALGRLDRCITRCTRIIEELLDFTRTPSADTTALDLDAWLGGVLDDQPVPAGITVVRRLHLDRITVPFDPERLRRAVINCYDNACQALGEDAAEDNCLTVQTRSRSRRIEIEFSDTGPGMPADVLENVFEPLFSTKAFGVGLGLPTVRQIMQQHGGDVEIDTEPGGGTRVVLWLPLPDPAPTA